MGKEGPRVEFIDDYTFPPNTASLKVTLAYEQALNLVLEKDWGAGKRNRRVGWDDCIIYLPFAFALENVI